MSKVDAQRAMKLARYEQMQALASAQRGGAPARVPAQPAGPAEETAPAKAARRATKPAEAEPAGPTDAPAAEALCGHRSIGNKACQRPAGHEEKNHRYK
jgi:hypothetical protein